MRCQMILFENFTIDRKVFFKKIMPPPIRFIASRCLWLVPILLLFYLCLLPEGIRADPSDNVLRFGYHVSHMGSFDPHLATASQDRVMADLVFNGLLRYVPGRAPEIEPDLARQLPSFYTENGKLVCRILLKKGVMFHAGPGFPSCEMTADDVVYSLNKSADKKRSAYAAGYACMAVKKIGRYGVEIVMDTPLSKLLLFPKLTDYGGGFIVSKKAVTTMGYEAFSNHPVGTGPFAFKEYLPGKKIELTAHKQYFRGTPKLAGVELHLLPALTDRQTALDQGRLDIIVGSGKEEWVKAMENRTDIQMDTHGVGEVTSIYFNTRVRPMDDVRVRKAIAYALDRKAFLQATNPLISGPVLSQVPTLFMAGGLSATDVHMLGLDYARNLKKAKLLLAEAGYADGFTLDLVTSEKRVYQAGYQSLKQQLAPIGIQCRIRRVPHQQMHQIIRDGDDPKAVVIYVAWRPNADAYLSQFFHSSFIPVPGKSTGTNFAGYDQIDKLIEDARFEVDSERQIDLWSQAQVRILSDMVALPLNYSLQTCARRTWLDYGHPLESSMALYPQFTENTCFYQEPASNTAIFPLTEK